MAEPTLNLARSDLYLRVALERGFDPNPTNWTANQQQVVDIIVSDGLRLFYYPPALEEGGPSYEWSFLKPVGTIQIPQGVKQVQLPDDFNGFAGDAILTAASGTATYPWTLTPTHIGYLLQDYAMQPTRTGPPIKLAEVVLKGTDTDRSTRYAVQVFPIPDVAYVLQAQYSVNADYISQQAPYAIGGPAHAQTIREACLAMSETFDGEQGAHWEAFYRFLAASISEDRKHKPIKLRRVEDHSDDVEDTIWPYPFMHGLGPHTYTPPPPGF